ncbi:MAG: 2-C-methyl-D-erythritol 2,4-cyclodiphosphate synthase [Candidatus Cloacimonetes bacterium]|nr:2-C-methyl-D-erythritol 2,4-cyclodiphosphate synthase [Candidatus Cloacimonadota bacterium]MBS3768366.1 2-C-methyl-D-erythritol 2,4-cyclodiphosphate synthase [Candidatus Cloacimonadota bacterium]
MRVGFGYDVHPLVKGKKLILGGIDIPFPKGLAGHSDADALIHAIIDALLGAANLEDIGSHFPDSDEKYKNIASMVLLKKVKKLIKAEAYEIENIDTTIVLEKPKLKKFVPKMKKNIANNLGINEKQISIKATKEESLGFVGQEKGIKVFTVCLLKEKS